MSKLYLQNIVDNISFENLPVMWQGFDLTQFSKENILFDFQKQGLQNALKGLWLYFKEQKENKIVKSIIFKFVSKTFKNLLIKTPFMLILRLISGSPGGT